MTTHPFTLTQPSPCRVCRGSGRVLVGNKRGELLTCAACNGTGTAPAEREITCPECDGECVVHAVQASGGRAGQITPDEYFYTCPECDGSGRVWVDAEEDAA